MSDDKLTHDKLPRPKNKPVPFAKVDTWDEASDYVLGAFHACVDKIDKTSGPEERLWASAAQAYIGAYMGMVGLKALPGDQGLAKFREQVAEANHKADQAAAAAKNA
jgi:hypothetical protein